MLATWGCTTFPKPTLSLDFLGATSLDSGITFSRGSQATLFDSTGTLVYAKHNLALQSQTFQTTWIVSNSSVSTDATVAPDGTTTADKLIENTANAVHQIDQTVTVLSSGTYAASFYIKADTRTKTRVAFITGGTGGVFADADLIAGTIGAATAFGGGVAISSAIHNMGNGWFRCIVTGIGPASTSGQLRVELLDAAGNRTYTGDGTSGLFLWGAQLNLANMEGGVTSSLTTYYPTTTAAYYAPRFDYNPSTLQPRGLLIEEQRTNSIRNNTMQGAVAGTPGTAPTNWFVTAAGGNLTSVEIVGIGAESGITYIDIRFVTSGAVNPVILFESTTQIVAANGQTWTSAIYNKLVNGSLTNVTVNNRIQYRDATGANLQAVDVVVTPTSAALSTQRNFNTATATNASTARITNGHLLTISAAADFTLRIGLPQLELGAFATSVIPTTTTALTRNADVASMTGTNFSSWFNAAGIGTLFAQAASRSTSTANALITQIDSGSSADIFGIYHQVDEQAVFRVRIGNVNIFGTGFGTLTDGVVAKTAAAFQSGSNAACLNGGTVVSNTTSFSAPTMSVLRIGTNQISTESINGWVQRFVYYPTRLPNTTLQALTA